MIKKIVAAVGLILILLGACAMDSDDLTIPAAVLVTGVCLVAIGADEVIEECNRELEEQRYDHK